MNRSVDQVYRDYKLVTNIFNSTTPSPVDQKTPGLFFLLRRKIKRKSDTVSNQLQSVLTLLGSCESKLLKIEDFLANCVYPYQPPVPMEID